MEVNLAKTLLIAFALSGYSHKVLANADVQLTNAESTASRTNNIIVVKERRLDGDWHAAWWELGSYMLLGIGMYSLEEETMQLDWDYEIEDGFLNHTWDRFTTKDAWKLDNNDFTMNWGHTYAGSFYHQAFRKNDLSFYQSLTGPIVGSLVWEGVIEYKEVVSINDHVTTMFGGAFLGEVFFQTSEMLKRKQSRSAHILASILNPSLSLENWYYDKGYNAPYRNFAQSFGFAKASEERFDLYSDLLYSNGTQYSDARTIALLGLNTRTDNLPLSYQQHQQVWFSDPVIATLNFELGFSSEGSDVYTTHAKLVYAGYANFVNNQQNHHRLIAGLWGGLNLVSFGKGDNEDFYGAINLAGFTVESSYKTLTYQLRTQFDFAFDFAMVRPFTKNAALADKQSGWWFTKPVLWQENYYYALGHSMELTSQLDIGSWQLSARLRHHYWDSIDHKEYERIGVAENRFDMDLKDTRFDANLSLGYQFTNIISAHLYLQYKERKGKAFGIDNSGFRKIERDNERLLGLRLSMSL